MSRFQITASIVVYEQTIESVRRTIESFLSTRLRVKLFLVANSSIPDLNVFLSDSRVEIIEAFDNPGFGKGHNMAIRKKIDTEYYLVLNPDISFKPDVLERLYQYMEDHLDVGNIMPKVLYPDGSLQRLCKLLPDPLNIGTRRFLPSLKWSQRMNDKYELKDFDYNSIMQIPNLSGCFMFMRNSILQITNGFDERFFLYLEDIDLNRRISKVAKTIYYPFVSIIHHHNRGSYNSRKLLKHHIFSAIRYFNKWGWFWDRERRAANRKTNEKIKQLIIAKKRSSDEF